MHGGAIALPGEPLGVKHCAEHHIKLKPGSNPVYINEYKLLHTQRQLVEELIKRHVRPRGHSGMKLSMELSFIFGAQEGRYVTSRHRFSESK